MGETRTEEARAGARKEERDPYAVLGNVVAMGAVDADDEAVEAEAAELVGQAARGQCVGRYAQQARECGAQVAVGETLGEEPEQDQGAQERVEARVGEAERRDPLAIDHLGGSWVSRSTWRSRRLA